MDRSDQPHSTVTELLSAARQIEAGAVPHLRVVKVGVLSTVTVETLRPSLVVEGAARGLWIRPYFAPFNQLEQQVFDARSPLHACEPDVVILAMRLEEIAPRMACRFLALADEEVQRELAAIEERLTSLVARLRRTTQAAILVCNYASPTCWPAGLADASREESLTHAVHLANQAVARCCRQVPGAYVLDYARIVAEVGLQRWSDPKLWYLGRIPFGAEAQRALGRWLARYLRAVCVSPCKCLVLDLDNTLWGGGLGEEGLGGIALGEDYPGNVYKAFQRRLLALRDEGVLLAAASKNDEREVRDVLARHPDAVLKAEHFAVMEIGWHDKATSLRRIAQQLRLGVEALAVFDDSAVERAWIRSQLPEVTVIEVPEDPLGFIQALEDSGAFDRLALSPEDLTRAAAYQQDQQRQRVQAQSESVEEFLSGLEMRATIGCLSQETLPRVAQLVAKTNQFNLTSRRHSAQAIQAMVDAGAVALWLRLADRFGDNGLVGVAIALPDGGPWRWRIDTFLLSCRVIGRGAETALLGVLLRRLRARGAREVLGDYVPTGTNRLAATFYGRHGFADVDGTGRSWSRSLGAEDLPLTAAIAIEASDELVGARTPDGP